MYDVLAPPAFEFLAQQAGPLQILLAIWSKVWPYLAMLAGFSLIVFVHELGHFAVAKWAGVRVDRFAIGFGRELFGFTKGETRYSFNVLPLGGYVKMLGQEDFDDKSEELKFKDDPSSFANKPVGHRMAIVSAGVIMNILFACFLFMLVFMKGMKAEPPKIAFVEPDSPADQAGILPGDIVKEVNGERILEYKELQFAVLLSEPHKAIDVLVEREGKTMPLRIEPEYRRPDVTGDVKRQVIGVVSSVTNEIVAVGPEIDETDPSQPHVGDRIIKMGDLEVTKDNANEARFMLAYFDGPVLVERPDSENPDAAPERLEVRIPPVMQIHPVTLADPTTVDVLGLRPLVRCRFAYPGKRGYLGGIRDGDTVLNFDDIKYPTQFEIARSVRDNAEQDIYFTVIRADGVTKYSGFVRPKAHKSGAGTIGAIVQTLPEGKRGKTGPQSEITYVQKGGPADKAGFEVGDVVLSVFGNENPRGGAARKAIGSNRGRAIELVVKKSDGSRHAAMVVPRAPGNIDAKFELIADDMMIVGGITPKLRGEPSPAAVSGIVPGSRIVSAAGENIATWQQLVTVFRNHAGSTIDIAYRAPGGEDQIAKFPVPHSLRTKLGVGPEAIITKIDGKDEIEKTEGDKTRHLSVKYRAGQEEMLKGLVGETVTVEYRRNILSDLETAQVEVTPEMTDAWLARLSYQPNVIFEPEMITLKGEGALDAVAIGVHKTYYFILQVYKIMERMIFTRSVGVENISGPLGIVDMGGKVAQTGLVEFLFFLAIISANLAVINFLPLPIVDGGLMVFLIIEKIKGSPVSLQIQVATQMIGLVLIAGIFLFVTYQDVLRLFG